MAEYDSIARQYRGSKRLPFRDHLERYSLFRMLGDVGGLRIVDLACGDGFYTRELKKAGASHVTGVDISAEMIRLADESERRWPLGCSYVQADAVTFVPAEPVELVVAAYLLNYAKTREELVRLCLAARNCLCGSGRFVGLNDNPHVAPGGAVAYLKYGFERGCDGTPPREGDAVRYRFFGSDGSFEFSNYYHSPATYEEAFREAGFRDFHWAPFELDPAQHGDPFWDDFMQSPPLVGFAAAKGPRPGRTVN